MNDREFLIHIILSGWELFLWAMAVTISEWGWPVLFAALAIGFCLWRYYAKYPQG